MEAPAPSQSLSTLPSGRLDPVLLSRTVVIQPTNPKRKNSDAWKRYEGYKSARTLGGVLDRGGHRADMNNDFLKGYMAFAEELVPYDESKFKRLRPSAGGAAARSVLDQTELIKVMFSFCNIRDLLAFHAVCRTAGDASWPLAMTARSLRLTAHSAERLVGALHLCTPEAIRTLTLLGTPPSVIAALRARAHKPMLACAAAVTYVDPTGSEWAAAVGAAAAAAEAGARAVEAGANRRRLTQAGVVRPTLQILLAGDAASRCAAARAVHAIAKTRNEQDTMNLALSGATAIILRSLVALPAAAPAQAQHHLAESLLCLLDRFKELSEYTVPSADTKEARFVRTVRSEFKATDGPGVLGRLLTCPMAAAGTRETAIAGLWIYLREMNEANSARDTDGDSDNEPELAMSDPELAMLLDAGSIAAVVQHAKPLLEPRFKIKAAPESNYGSHDMNMLRLKYMEGTNLLLRLSKHSTTCHGTIESLPGGTALLAWAHEWAAYRKAEVERQRQRGVW
jgi:hypothetical protein